MPLVIHPANTAAAELRGGGEKYILIAHIIETDYTDEKQKTLLICVISSQNLCNQV
jgi:hypothetical protein